MPDLLALRDLAEALAWTARTDPLPAFKEFRQKCAWSRFDDPGLSDWLAEECRVGYELATHVEAALFSERLTDAEVAAIGDRYTGWILQFTQRAAAVVRDRSSLSKLRSSSPE